MGKHSLKSKCHKAFAISQVWFCLILIYCDLQAPSVFQHNPQLLPNREASCCRRDVCPRFQVCHLGKKKEWQVWKPYSYLPNPTASRQGGCGGEKFQKWNNDWNFFLPSNLAYLPGIEIWTDLGFLGFNIDMVSLVFSRPLQPLQFYFQYIITPKLDLCVR